MGVELTEIPGWTCCGATSAHVTSDLLAVALPAANIVRAGALGADVLAPCAACYNRLATARERVLSDASLRARVEEAIGAEFPSERRIVHPLNAFTREDVRLRLKSPLSGLKAVAYYGCLLTRPQSISVDPDTVNPTVMDRLVQACGADVLDWPFRTECCGATHSLTKPATAQRLMGRLLEAAAEAGADCIITACPLCQSNLDVHQDKVEHAVGRLFNMPVVFFTELLSLALGVPPARLELGRHVVGTSALLAHVTP
jgi:heterodisulfide reductase subunit B